MRPPPLPPQALLLPFLFHLISTASNTINSGVIRRWCLFGHRLKKEQNLLATLQGNKKLADFLPFFPVLSNLAISLLPLLLLLLILFSLTHRLR